MGVEVVVPEVVKMPVENGFSGPEHEEENETLVEPVTFGSNEDDIVKAKAAIAPETIVPTNVADEWPAPKQIHSFYFIRYRPYDDPKIKAKIDIADKELTKRNQRRFQLTDELKAKRADRAEVIRKLKDLTGESRQYKEAADDKRKEMGPLQQALGQMRNNNNNGGRGAVMCSSEEELNNVIYSLKYRIQHESIPLSEEKQILREIKQLEGTRKEVIANAARRTQIQESLGPKEDLQDKVKLITVDLNGVKKEQQAISAKIKTLDEAKKAIDEEIRVLQDELGIVTEKRDEAYQTIQGLRKQREDGNTNFYQNRHLLNTVKELCYKKDVQALEELAHTEVEKFMSSWCSSKAVRDDYEKRILASLDSRQLSRDGRMRNPDEKPLVVVEAPKPPEIEIIAKPNVKRPKEESKPAPQQDTPVLTQKTEKDSRTVSKHNDVETEEIYGLEITQAPVKNEIDVTKLKEALRQEEIAKAKQAMERKKKLADKAAAKAAIRAQKEAEKKQQVLERKLKKKTAGPDTEESSEVAGELPEPEKAAEETAEAPVSAKPKALKDNNKIRYRTRARGPEALPKVILKRKKSSNYWIWAAPAVFVFLVLVALGYRYLL